MRRHLQGVLAAPAVVLVNAATPVHADSDAFPRETEAALQAIYDIAGPGLS